MHEFWVDQEKNRLYLNFKNKITMEEAETCFAEWAQLASRLKPGFGEISDLSELECFEPRVEDTLGSILKFERDFGVGKKVRIISKSPSGEAILELFEQKSKEAGLTAKVVGTMEEAEQVLDELEQN